MKWKIEVINWIEDGNACDSPLLSALICASCSSPHMLFHVIERARHKIWQSAKAISSVNKEWRPHYSLLASMGYSGISVGIPYKGSFSYKLSGIVRTLAIRYLMVELPAHLQGFKATAQPCRRCKIPAHRWEPLLQAHFIFFCFVTA